MKKPSNPYPEEVFIEPTKEQYELFHKTLQKQGLTLDKFSGAVGRRLWDSLNEEWERFLPDKYELTEMIRVSVLATYAYSSLHSCYKDYKEVLYKHIKYLVDDILKRLRGE